MDFNGCKLYIKWNYRRTDHCGYCSDRETEEHDTNNIGKIRVLRDIPSFITCKEDLKSKRNELIREFNLKDRHCCWNGNNKYGTFNSNISFKIISDKEVPIYKIIIKELDDYDNDEYDSDNEN
jgi:hypothetical protein